MTSIVLLYMHIFLMHFLHDVSYKFDKVFFLVVRWKAFPYRMILENMTVPSFLSWVNLLFYSNQVTDDKTGLWWILNCFVFLVHCWINNGYKSIYVLLTCIFEFLSEFIKILGRLLPNTSIQHSTKGRYTGKDILQKVPYLRSIL